VAGLTINAAVSFLDTKIKRVLTPTGDVTRGADLAFAPSFQGNLRARYEWDLSTSLKGHIMPQISHSASSRSDIIDFSASRVKSWTTVALSAGVKADRWSAEVYADNLTNTRQELAANGGFDQNRVTVGRPRTIGLRVGFKY
jgi:iron complex outermembrane recepter protein